MSTNPDYEAEMALVFSKDCKDATLENALDCVLGCVRNPRCEKNSSKQLPAFWFRYFALNDVSARCWQSKAGENQTDILADAFSAPRHFETCTGNSGQWSFSKGLDSHAPMGPHLVTKDALGKGDGLKIQMHLNGKLMQNASTSDMVSP